MYVNRLKAYKQIGYELASSLKSDKQAVNAIYDGDNYIEIFHKNLFDANKNIIVFSPAISGLRVYELISMLKEKQEAGVQVSIVTWMPESYGFGDASYWMQRKRSIVRRHIVGGINRTLISVKSPSQLCRTGTRRRLSAA